MIKIILSLVLLLSDNSGCGDKKSPAIPEYTQSDQTKALQDSMYNKSLDLNNMSYEDLLKTFGGTDSAMSTKAQDQMSGLLDSSYTPTSYDDYLKRLNSVDTSGSANALKSYQDMVANKDYSLTDFSKTEKEYLDSVMNQYNQSRQDSLKPVQESLIAENLYGSGAGYGVMNDYAKQSSQGASDLAKQWAYEGIARQQQQQQYNDALQRGDYTTMYNMALTQEQNKLTNVNNATSYAEASKQYSDALQRGDITTAVNMAETLKQNQSALLNSNLSAYENAMAPASNVYTGLVSLDDKNYQTDLAQYAQAVADQNKTKNWELGLSKMMSMADPAGSYLGNYNKPQQGDTAQSMQGLSKAIQLYSAFKNEASTNGVGSLTTK